LNTEDFFFPKHKCFKKCDQLKAKKQIFTQIFGNEWGYCSRLHFKKAPVLLNADGIFEASCKVI